MARDLNPDAVQPAPWRNGAGSTRVLASHVDEKGRVTYRISVADLVSDAEFSTFPGLDRLFVALGELTLTVDDVATRLERWGQLRFPGEASSGVRLSAPTQALNVMTGRGRCHAEVSIRDVTSPPAPGAQFSVAIDDRRADIILTEMEEL